MGKSDAWVIIILAALIIIYIVIWITGYFTHGLAYLLAFLNLFTTALIIGYWAVNEIRIQRHSIEAREIIVLGFELMVAVCSVCLIFFHTDYKWLKTLQYLIFAIHLIALIAGLIFMLTFKINKLF